MTTYARLDTLNRLLSDFRDSGEFSSSREHRSHIEILAAGEALTSVSGIGDSRYQSLINGKRDVVKENMLSREGTFDFVTAKGCAEGGHIVTPVDELVFLYATNDTYFEIHADEL